MSDDQQRPGGFIRDNHGILSPPPSSVSSTTNASLPNPRSKPLVPGSAKESSFIRYLDEQLLRIQRRHANRHGNTATKTDIGYSSFKEAIADIETLVELIWVSGTPSLQVPYLLSIALLTVDFLPSFPPSPTATFRLLNRLDVAFASLIQGQNVETGERLPGFERGPAVSTTQKIRIKSLVERTRMTAIRVLGPSGGTDISVQEESMDVDTETDYADFGFESDDEDEDDELDDHDIGRREMGIARIYDRTVVELGEVLGQTPIGIITE
ncbi:hypothetical protein BT63DRAFT_457549 [Microthyrium microscopicum]|uniref:Meiotic recombination protein DMC1 n=1 Tax=Microthyrium microscopicum TaxID=703497 RepID=A0A6A6U3X5_9PEZI|nr:hypothetical protein BT63DRAFT_457549 [Microthyrium microscopicum]